MSARRGHGRRGKQLLGGSVAFGRTGFGGQSPSAGASGLEGLHQAGDVFALLHCAHGGAPDSRAFAELAPFGAVGGALLLEGRVPCGTIRTRDRPLAKIPLGEAVNAETAMIRSLRSAANLACSEKRGAKLR